ncbi:MAG TPA: TIGR02647 family protein [Methylophaga aminisulfidivorans]|uniref:TIGR02647 family protein n=2 Tax=root TaxID=1 RepID=A0A7C2A9B7_9GAMM|nr:TIGR02647 family protein [Methylophaga sp.]HEC75592.1 TIGR02647 family protein [Methylophaga aminisulfidivorans]
MTIKQSLIDELEVLIQFPLDSTQAGIKIHHEARDGLKQAAQSLFDKGLISQEDGGYLTDLGYEAAEHLQHAMRIMSS